MRKDALADRLSDKDLAHHDKHMIGDYARNANTGNHVFNIFLDGVDGQVIEVKY